MSLKFDEFTTTAEITKTFSIGTTGGAVDDVKVNGTSVVNKGIANIDLTNYATVADLNQEAEIRENEDERVLAEAKEYTDNKPFKTINGQIIKGEGNIEVEGGDSIEVKYHANEKEIEINTKASQKGVVANPSEDATDTLQKIKVGDKTYGIDGKGTEDNPFDTLYANNLSDGTTTKTMADVLAVGGGGLDYKTVVDVVFDETKTVTSHGTLLEVTSTEDGTPISDLKIVAFIAAVYVPTVEEVTASGGIDVFSTTILGNRKNKIISNGLKNNTVSESVCFSLKQNILHFYTDNHPTYASGPWKVDSNLYIDNEYFYPDGSVGPKILLLGKYGATTTIPIGTRYRLMAITK